MVSLWCHYGVTSDWMRHSVLQCINSRLSKKVDKMPLHMPTDKTRSEVSALTSFGITQEEIAAYLDIDPKTLRKHYQRELATGKTAATAKIAQRLFDVAMEGNVAALIFWLKTRARWRDDGGDTNEDVAQPIAVTVEVKDARKKADDAKS